MKLEELKGKNREEQYRLIGAMPQVDINEMLENPDKMRGKIIIFHREYDPHDAQELCIRVFEYLEKTGKWHVADVDLSDMKGFSFDRAYDKDELWRYFRKFFEKKGFLLEK